MHGTFNVSKQVQSHAIWLKQPITYIHTMGLLYFLNHYSSNCSGWWVQGPATSSWTIFMLSRRGTPESQSCSRQMREGNWMCLWACFLLCWCCRTLFLSRGLIGRSLYRLDRTQEEEGPALNWLKVGGTPCTEDIQTFQHYLVFCNDCLCVWMDLSYFVCDQNTLNMMGGTCWGV